MSKTSLKNKEAKIKNAVESDRPIESASKIHNASCCTCAFNSKHPSYCRKHKAYCARKQDACTDYKLKK